MKKIIFFCIAFSIAALLTVMLCSCGNEEKAEVTGAATDSVRHDDPTMAPENNGEKTAVPAPDFELLDQFGKVRKLSDYKGKVVFLNFWATWCPPCRGEMPDIQRLYEKYGDDGEVAILGVAFPGSGGETDAQGVADFLSENGYTYPVAMDNDGTLLSSYGISAFPTTFMIDADGNIFGYVSGALSEAMMQQIIDQTASGVMEPIDG